jgi:ATP-dependent DNA helicase RecG
VLNIVDSLRAYGSLDGLTLRQEAVASMLALTDLWHALPSEGVADEDGTGGEPGSLAGAPELSAAVRPAPATPVPDPLRLGPKRPTPPSGPRATPVGTASLSASINRLPGVGPRHSALLGKMGVHTVGDLLWLLPRRYNDFSAMKPIHQLRQGEEITILANLWDLKVRRLPGRDTAIVTGILSDSTATIEATWFNQWVTKQLRSGQTYVFSGKVDSYLGRLVLRHPEFEEPDQELLHTGRMVPVYPLTKGITERWLRTLQKNVVDEWGRRVHDHLPDAVLRRTGLLPLSEALEQMHFPAGKEKLAAARRRLAFDEFFLIQIGVLRQRREYSGLPALSLPLEPGIQDAFEQALPFQFTGAQMRASRAILNDLASNRPMSRLLQGDVGSGKTAVAANAMWAAITNGAQAAMMAPTEILAEQHWRSLTHLFEKLDVQGRPARVALLTGSQKSAERAEALQALASGEVDIAVGTHALIQEGVTFRNLGLAIIDEQHRFGVRQRASLRRKGEPTEGDESQAPVPHMLVMTATPIPRTLSLTVFGDLDVSVIDEMPPGRQPIKTRWLLPKERERAYSFIRRQVEQGRQAFIIYPLVEESESLDAKAAVPEYAQLGAIFPSFRLGLLHGRMKGEEKDTVMQAMQAGAVDILVATSVVEVGIDVPNATVILVEDAERFGLAQLHQFRGRVGRGEHASYCILISDATTPNAAERLQALEQSQDGFALAEKDLQLRGPGDFFGTRQSGLPDLKLAQLSDLRTLELAREEAMRVLEEDPDLSLPKHLALARKARQFWHGEGDAS